MKSEDAIISTINATLQVGNYIPEYDPAQDPGIVQVVIKYPKDFSGPKFYADGDEPWVSIESAKQFVDAGIATYKKEDKSKKTDDK